MRREPVKTTVDGLDKAIKDTLDAFRNATDETVDNAIKLTARDALKELKNAHPAGSGKYGSWDDYNKSWTIKHNSTDKRFHRSETIHNKDYYGLTHLLENGHALPQGDRSKSYPHIAPVAEKADAELLRRIKEGI